MTYVTSDIHGNLRRFQSILSQISLTPEDTLFVLGDVIDRHPQGVEILRYIMHQPNIKMLLGNHEQLMIDTIAEYPQPHFSNVPRQLWYINHGQMTEKAYSALSDEEKKAIFNFLIGLPLSFDIEVNGIKFKLVHGAPPEWFESGCGYFEEIDFSVWSRIEKTTKVDGYTLIFGHTPTDYYQDADPLKIWYGKNKIGIDCGSGWPEHDIDFDRPLGRLACLRLDDMKEYYSEELTPNEKLDS